MECSTGPLSFLHVNVSGGEFCEVHDNMREEPALTVTVDDDGVSIIGAAVYRDESWLSDHKYKTSELTSSIKVYMKSNRLVYH